MLRAVVWLFAVELILWAALIFWALFAFVEAIERRISNPARAALTVTSRRITVWLSRAVLLALALKFAVLAAAG